MNEKIEPGLTLTLGENLRLLNKAMTSLAKARVAKGEMTRVEMVKVVARAANNIKIAKNCFEEGIVG